MTRGELAVSSLRLIAAWSLLFFKSIDEVIVTPSSMRVLVTGASGVVGRAFRHYHRGYYSLRLTYHRTPVKASPGEEVVPVDITDLRSVLKAVKGVEAIVHLAADARITAPWNSVLERNIIGTYNVFEAARRSGVRKVVFASSNHACGFSVRESDLVGPDAPVRPDSLYGVSKVFGEALGRCYSDRFGLSVVCLRIGLVRSREPETLFKEILSGETADQVYSARKLAAMWISGRDVAQLIHRSLEADLRFGIFYGASDNTQAVLDISDAKERLGYKPQDRLEDHVS